MGNKENRRPENNRKKRLLMVSEAMGGGVFTYLVELSNHLADRYEIMLAYGVRIETPSNFKEYFDSRIQWRYIENFVRPISPFKDWKAMCEIRRVAEEFQPDIIHLHSSKAGVLGRIAFWNRKVRLFYTPHAYSFLMDNYGPVKKQLFRGIEWLCARSHCVTISCSFGEHEETLKLTKRAVFVHNGIDPEELERIVGTEEDAGKTNAPEKLIEAEKKPIGQSENHKPVIYTVGRLCYQKNPALFNRIAEQFPDVTFVWVGDGSRRELLKSPNIHISGWLTREEAIRTAEPYPVFLLTSLWEGLPVSLLEAMARKKVCIVSNVIGNRDVIRDGENGFLCTDFEDYIKAIQKALADPCEALREQACRDVERQYNIQHMAETYDRIYSRVKEGQK
ncbi:MAG: glycosyltransferase [Lachnospiraceae bacterium]|nr:glycosyltransferase [Lachnospiraceae bacterium]